MPPWLLQFISVEAMKKLKSWLIKHGFKFFAKWYVKQTSNKWDDKAFLIVEAITDNDPSTNAEDHMNSLIEELTKESK